MDAKIIFENGRQTNKLKNVIITIQFYEYDTVSLHHLQLIPHVFCFEIGFKLNFLNLQLLLYPNM